MIPQQVAEKIDSFLRAGRTGNVVLDIKDGRIVGWKVSESGRIDTRRDAIA